MRIASRIVALAVFLTLMTGSTASALDLETDVKPPPGEVGTPYTFQFLGEEGCLPYRFSYLNGTVPPGLRITQDGKLTGTPTEAGAFNFWVGLDDSVDCMSLQSQGEFTMIVLPDLAVGTTSLPRATPGQPYTATLAATNTEVGWPLVWDITQGTLPQGLALSPGGVISGTPTGPDTKTFVVRAREPFRRFGERQLTLAVAAGLQARSALRPGEVGLRYAGSLPATGGTPPLTWSLASGTLPRGLSLDAATGAIRGVPRAPGRFPVTAAIKDAAGQQTTVTGTLRIAARLDVVTTRLPRALVGDPYSARLAATGGLEPVQWRIVRGVLAPGVRLDPSTGALSGTPRREGTYRITVRATDRLGVSSTRTLRLVVTG